MKMKNLYCIPSPMELPNFLDFSEEYNASFEYNEFFLPHILDDGTATERIIKAYQSTGRNLSDDTLHGAFLDICINSTDSKIFAASDFRVRQCMDIARRMGLKAVIFHTNYIVNFHLQSYLNTWLEKNEEYWRKLLKDYPGQMVYLENMFDDAPEMLTELARRMADEPRFGVCLDIAHAKISGSPVERWLEALGPYTVHLHINDNDGNEDLHQAVGSGIADWKQYDTWCHSLSSEPSALIEVRTFEELIQSVEYMKREHIYPF